MEAMLKTCNVISENFDNNLIVLLRILTEGIDGPSKLGHLPY